MSVPATAVDAEPEVRAFEPQIVGTTDVEFSATLSEIAKALIRAQNSMDEIFKDSTNPHFRSKYAGLPACINATKPALLANGIALLQPATSSADASVVYVTTMFLHESGEWMRCKLGLQPVKSDPQGAGSAITYGKRYTLLGMCGVAPEDDDDGNAASRPVRAPRAQPRPNPAPAPANAPQPAERPGNSKPEAERISKATVDKIFAAFARIGADDNLESKLLAAATNGRVTDPLNVPFLTVPEAAALSPLIAAEEAKRPEPAQCPECTGLDNQHLDDDLGPCVNDHSDRAIAIQTREIQRERYPEATQGELL